MTTEFEDDAAERTMVGRAFAAEAAPVQFGHFLDYTLEGETKHVRLAADQVMIGRVAPADIVIASPEISRRHCRIDIQGDHAILTDLGSTNGTFFDGVKIDRPTRLRSGTRIGLGAFSLRYHRRDLNDVAAEAEHLADLKRAEDYVRAILPPPITAGPVRTEWRFVPSAKLGGDAFGYQYLTETIFTGFVLDVSGHGIGSAMHAANVANVLRRRALPGVDFRDPTQVAAGLNQVFPMEEHNGLMLTLWYFAYHLPTRQMRYCAAGHHPSYLLCREAFDPAPLWLRSPAIGMLPNATYRMGTAEMSPAAKLFIFSDGVFEILTPDGQQGSIDDFRALLTAPVAPGAAITDSIYKSVRARARPGPLDDDFSVLMITFD